MYYICVCFLGVKSATCSRGAATASLGFLDFGPWAHPASISIVIHPNVQPTINSTHYLFESNTNQPYKGVRTQAVLGIRTSLRASTTVNNPFVLLSMNVRSNTWVIRGGFIWEGRIDRKLKRIQNSKVSRPPSSPRYSPGSSFQTPRRMLGS